MAHLARLADFSDREFLHIVDDCAGEDGWTTTADIADTISRAKRDTDLFKDAMRSAGSRLSWLRRFGVVERNDNTGDWRINEDGQQFLNGKLRASVGGALPKLKDGEMVEVLNQLASRYRTTSRTSAIIMRREWQRGTIMGYSSRDERG